MIFRRSFVLGLLSTPIAGCLPAGPVERTPNNLTIIAHGGGTIYRDYEADIARQIGGKGAPLLISPYSGEPKSTALDSAELLRGMGFRNVSILDITQPQNAVRQIQNTRGIWFSGGYQKQQVLSLASIPSLIDTLKTAYQNGVVMIGSSAGAAVMTKLMISGGTNGAVYTRAGLGFWPEVVLDQHVGQRHREYRLQKVIAGNPNLVGIGLDESTWIIRKDGGFTVRGRGVARVVFVGEDGQLTEKRLKSGANYII